MKFGPSRHVQALGGGRGKSVCGRRSSPPSSRALIATLAPSAAPAAALDDVSAPLRVIVAVPTSAGPRPTGTVLITHNGRRLLSLPLLPGLEPLASITALLSAALAVLGNEITVSYSGDAIYEQSPGVARCVGRAEDRPRAAGTRRQGPADRRAREHRRAVCARGARRAPRGRDDRRAHVPPAHRGGRARGAGGPPALQRLGATALRLALFLFLASIVLGSSWQLWVGAALFAIPQLLSIYEDRFPSSPSLHRVLPKGIVELVVMLFVGSAVGALALSTMDENAETFLANSFVLLALPGFVLSLVNLFGREGEEPHLGWGKRIAGIAVLAAGVMIAA